MVGSRRGVPKPENIWVETSFLIRTIVNIKKDVLKLFLFSFDFETENSELTLILTSSYLVGYEASSDLNLVHFNQFIRNIYF